MQPDERKQAINKPNSVMKTAIHYAADMTSASKLVLLLTHGGGKRILANKQFIGTYW